MITCSTKSSPSEEEVKKIYEKSVKLLSDSQVKLSEMQQVLKKAVVRLAFVAESNDKEVNDVLTGIKESVSNNIKVKQLNAELDNLFVLMNRPEHDQDISKQQGFYHHLKSSLDKLEHSISTGPWTSKITGAIDKKLPDEKMSIEILKIISETSISNHELDETNKDEIDDNQTSSDNVNLKINSLLINIIDQLSLAGKDQQQQISVQKALNSPADCNNSWFDAIEQAIFLINQSFSSAQSQNQDLQSFIVKINVQLSELKSFLLMTRQNSEDTVNCSSILQESVDTSVCSIQQKISSANNISDLKNDISAHLKKIRKQVKENKFAEQKKEEISVKGFAHIINELNNTQKQLQVNKEQLLRDTLTGLHNRLAYEERIKVEVSRWKRSKTPLSLAIWDIDYFKNVNDNYGHDIGDRVLQFFSKIIQSRIRDVDLFARIGGEEFVLLMPDTSLDNAMQLNNDLRELIENCKFHYNGQSCPVTASVGVAEFQQDDDAAFVLKRADQALYQSKNAGRNCCTSL